MTLLAWSLLMYKDLAKYWMMGELNEPLQGSLGQLGLAEHCTCMLNYNAV